MKSADRGDRGRQTTSRPWSCEWPKRTGIGAIVGCRVRCPTLGHDIARSTIADILKRHGIEPAPERKRKTTWKEFLSRHWELIVATDFFTVEVWTRRGLQRFIVLFFIDLATRKVEIAGIAQAANGLWMSQIARNLTGSIAKIALQTMGMFYGFQKRPYLQGFRGIGSY